jgi:hypothetical protein
MPEAAYLDTTILVEVCLKKGDHARRINEVLGQYDERNVSSYCLKEFRAGALNNIVLYHNKLVGEARAFEHVFDILDKLDQGGARRYRSKIAAQVTKSLVAGIPDDEPKGSMLGRLCDELSDLILDAWEDVLELGDIIEPIACYDGKGPVYNETSRQFDMPVCWPNPPHHGCCAAIRAQEVDVIDTTITALAHEAKQETRKRVAALQSAQGSANVTRHQCRHFGDFAVVLFAPDHAHVLSTNHSDFPQLCRILGKTFRDPLS